MNLSSLPGRHFPQGTSIGEYVVTILKDYNKSLPVDFLASLLSRDEAEIQAELRILEASNIIVRENNMVRLTHHST